MEKQLQRRRLFSDVFVINTLSFLILFFRARYSGLVAIFIYVKTVQNLYELIKKMFDLSTFNVEKLVHDFFQRLNLQVDSPVHKSAKKVSFVTQVDSTRRIKRELLCIAEKIKNIVACQNLDLSNDKHIRYVIEKHTNFLDRAPCSEDVVLLTSRLKNTNKKIVQRVKTRRSLVDCVRKAEARKVTNKNEACSRNMRLNTTRDYKKYGLQKNSCPMSIRENQYNYNTYETQRCRRILGVKNSKVLCSNAIGFEYNKLANSLPVKQDVKKARVKHSLINGPTCYVKREVEMAEKFLRLCIRDVEFMKEYLHITLCIAKELNGTNDMKSEAKCDQILLLCQYAILCFIEPSKRVFVSLENDLPTVIEKYLSEGCEYQFDFQRCPKHCYSAVLILSRWTKALMKQLDTTMIHTICGILGCSMKRILVLSHPTVKP